MRKIIVLLFLGFSLVSAIAQTNDFFDDAETLELGLPVITAGGEIANPGPVDISGLPMHSVIVKEARYNGGTGSFTGAYRFDGYSLADILDHLVLKKKNEDAFPPVIDLYVEVTNRKGEKAIFSWGELYYTTFRHQVIVATRVARIVPTKSKDLWPLPSQPRLIAAADLFTERNLEEPVSVTIRSAHQEFNIDKGMKHMYSPMITLMRDGKKYGELTGIPGGLPALTYPAVSYGRGLGIHGITPFSGVLLKDLLKPYWKITADVLRKGYLVIGGKDGYHGVFTASEVFNRNDQSEMLIFEVGKDKDGGRYKIFPAGDFFSDRAIKSVEMIYLESLP